MKNHVSQNLSNFFALQKNEKLHKRMEIFREKVRTTNFTTSKTKKNIEKVGDDHYIENGF
jgi:uncharacterized protein YdaU (DUF1376 family)